MALAAPTSDITSTFGSTTSGVAFGTLLEALLVTILVIPTTLVLALPLPLGKGADLEACEVARVALRSGQSLS